MVLTNDNRDYVTAPKKIKKKKVFTVHRAVLQTVGSVGMRGKNILFRP